MSGEIRAITMPKWGLAMEEGMVAAWHVDEGGAVKNGDEVLDIETSKITNAYEATETGVLRRQVVPEGETVPVGALLGVIADADVSDADIDSFVAEFQAEFAIAAKESATAAPAPESIEAGGRQMAFLKLGDGDATPLVLVHGFGGDMNNWLFNQPALAEGRAVYALDLPGHGISGKDVGAGDLVSLTSAVGGFMDAAGIGAAHLAGHSLGGAVVAELALTQPERAASLTLVAPAGLGPEINMDYIDGFIAAGRRKEMKAVLAMLVADESLVSRDMVNDVLKFKRLDGVDAALRAIADRVFADGRQSTLLADRLGDLATPAQAIWGRQDRILPPAHADALPANVPAHLVDAGHLPHMEAAAEVNRLLADLLG